eukprot:4494271-Alexandrium_andersonii.AAC.1
MDLLGTCLVCPRVLGSQPRPSMRVGIAPSFVVVCLRVRTSSPSMARDGLWQTGAPLASSPQALITRIQMSACTSGIERA